MSSRLNEKVSRKNDVLNKDYAVDTAYTLQYTRWLLKILGVWPMFKRNPNKLDNYVSKILIITSFFFSAFIIIPATLHMILIEKDALVRLTLFGPIGFCFSSIVKYCLIMFRRETIKRSIEHVEIDWMEMETTNDRDIMIRNVNVGRHITVLCAIFMYTGGLSYHTILLLWRGNEINELNETIRPLPYLGYDMFVHPNTSPIYEIIFSVDCMSACVMFTVTTTACNLAATFVAHVCGQIEIMMSRLETFFDKVDEASEILGKRIGPVVKSHVRVLRLTSFIETLFHETCLVEVVGSIIMICLLEYYCMTTWNDSETVAIMTYSTLLTSLTFNIFIFCHIGELLKGQCAKISEGAYMMDWHRFPGKTGLALVMIIAMAHRPRKLTAGRMMELSVSSFGSIIKTSVVYLNMLRKMAD